jgi:hypothetical protein
MKIQRIKDPDKVTFLSIVFVDQVNKPALESDRGRQIKEDRRK